MTKEDKKIFDALDAKFKKIRPVFAGQPRWQEYRTLFDLHRKLYTKKYSQVDTSYKLSEFNKLLYCYEKNIKPGDIKKQVVVG